MWEFRSDILHLGRKLQKWSLSAEKSPYLGWKDIVTYLFCEVSLHKWLQNDDTIAEHRNFNANCKFIRLLQDCNNSRDNRTYNFHFTTKIFIIDFISFIQSIFVYFKSTINSYFYGDSVIKLFTNTDSNICKTYLKED